MALVKKMIVFCICFVLTVIPFSRLSIFAANVSYFEDVMDRLNEGNVTAHVLYFTLTQGLAAGGNITITFPSSSFVFGSAYGYMDMEFAVGNGATCSSATYTTKTLAASPSGSTWGATYSTNVVTFTSGTDTITANRCVRVFLLTHGVNHTLTNPTVSADTVYRLKLATSSSENGEAAVIVFNDLGTPDSDQIQLTTRILPTIALDIDVSPNNCANSTETSYPNNVIAFGLLRPGVPKYSTTNVNYICVDAATNSATGMQIYARSSRSNAVGGLLNGSNVIVSQTADLNSTGVTQGYGLRVFSVGTTEFGTFTKVAPFDSVTAGSVGQINGATGSASLLVNSTAPVKSTTNNRITIEVGVKAASTTPAGNYSDTITLTAVTNF